MALRWKTVSINGVENPHFSKEALMTPLCQRMTEDMQVRSLALNTQESYLQTTEIATTNSPAIRCTNARNAD